MIARWGWQAATTMAVAIGAAVVLGCGRSAADAGSRGSGNTAAGNHEPAGAESSAGSSPAAASSRGAPRPTEATAAPSGGRFPVPRRVVFLGTSLTAGLGLDPDQAYPALIQQRLDSAGLAFTAVNAGVSGETSAGALRRIDWLMREPAAVLVIETGANDMLRGLDPDSLEANIQSLIDRARRDAPPPRLVLLGMQALPNYGQAYARRFNAVYPALAKRNDVPLVPFLLQGVAGVDSLNQADMVHPTAAGQERMAATVWPVLERVLREAA